MRRLIAVVLVIAAGLTWSAPADGAGSSNFYPPTAATCAPGGQCRATIEWRTSSYGPTATGETRIRRRTLFSVYAAAGEQILLGSSALGAMTGGGTNLSDIVAWNPGTVSNTEVATLPSPDYSCLSQRSESGNSNRGELKTRTQELNGPASIDGTQNAGGYRPCYYTAPSSGIYRVAFYGTAGGNSDAQLAPDGVINPAGGTFPNPTASTAVYAWDITVRPAAIDSGSSADFSGRVFTYVFAAFTGSNPRPVSMSFYLNTSDGFRYRVNSNGMDPNGFVLYGNQNGFADADGSPLNRDVVAIGSATQNLSTLQGGTHLLPPQYPLSFEALSPATLTALGIPTAPVDPVLNTITYTGQVTATGSYVNKGGNFTLTTGASGTYEIVVSRSGTNFDPGLSANATIRGVVNAAGSHVIAWDGKDNTGAAFPVGSAYKVEAQLRGGEYHAPMLDVESSVNGGPSITLENPPGNKCPFTNATSTGTNCSQAFFDDRGYVSSTGTSVGTPGGMLCPTIFGTVPNPLFADPATGFDSKTTGRAFGNASGSNANAYCAANGTLGDSKGLDVWTYFPSSTQVATLDVLALPAAPVATDDLGSTGAGVALNVASSIGVLANDTGASLTVSSNTAASHGTLTVRPDGSYTYIPASGFSGSDSATYTVSDNAGQTTTATLNLTVRPTAVNDSYSTDAGTPINFNTSDLLANDLGQSRIFTSSTPVTHGTLSIGSGGAVVYTPDAGFSGADSFTYVLTGAGGTSTGTVSIVVRPLSAVDTSAGKAGAPITGNALGNDTGTGLRVTGHTSPLHGSVIVQPSGAYTYTAASTFVGNDSFDYTAVDLLGTVTTGTVNIAVAAADPVAPTTTTTTTAPTTTTPPVGTPPTTSPVATSPVKVAFTGVAHLSAMLALAVSLLVFGAGLMALRRRFIR